MRSCQWSLENSQTLVRVGVAIAAFGLMGASAQAQKAYYQGKTVLDPQFHKEYKKFTADEPTPLMPENHEQAINEIPRETEVVEIFKQIIGAGPLPSRR
jgi:hypothetical protein